MSNSRPADSQRPASSRGSHKTSGTSSISEVLGDLAQRGHKKSNSFSSRRMSEASARRSDDVAAVDGQVGTNRWSSSTASSTGLGHHRKTGSFSKRFSFGSSLNSGFRSLSPSKRRAPFDTPNETLQPPEVSPASLPNPTRFSPLTLPNLPPGLGLDASAGSESQHPPETAVFSSHDDARTFSESPSRRAREAQFKPGSHLSDIIELDRPPNSAVHRQVRASPTRFAPQVRERDVRSAESRGPVSRESSPTKKSPSASSDQSVAPPLRRRSKRDRDKKAMLSKALRRANEAVHLDNEQSFEQAIWAYEEACSLLDAVLARTSTESERQKLTSIRETYSLRVQDLRHIQSRSQNGALHSASGSVSTGPDIHQPLQGDLDAEAGMAVGIATTTPAPAPVSPGEQEPLRLDARYQSQQTKPATQVRRPNPLSPRLQAHESHDLGAPTTARKDNLSQRESGVVGPHSGKAMRDTGSWFIGAPEDVISDNNSPHHSLDSHEGMRRRNIRTEPNDTEAEFDAALEAAIESAYDEGYEPFASRDYDSSMGIPPIAPLQTRDPISEQTRSYALRQAKIQRLSQRSRSQIDPDFAADFSDGGSGIDSDEEDRLLAAGRDVNLVHPAPGSETSALSPPGLPRQSDSSEVSNQTWASSAASSVNTGATSLETVDEHAFLPPVAEDESPTSGNSASCSKGQSPQRAVGGSPSRELKRDIFGASGRGESPLRDRRVSGNSKARSLRIETQAPSRRPSETPNETETSRGPDTLKPAPAQPPSVRGASRLDPGGLTCPYPSPNVAAFQSGTYTPTTPSFSKTPSSEQNDLTVKPDRPQLKHNASSLSLSKQAQLGIRTPDGTDPSPDTPLSFGFSSILTPPDRQDLRLGQPLSTPMDSTFGSLPTSNSIRMGIFDHEIHSATLPGSPNPELPNGPKSLEPCPESLLLRPYWLLRCVQQTLVHPKGGYLTTRLFVPHEVWGVKTSKLKSVEEKIANIDLLTAALLKLSAVNTEDADAVLDEMQSLENVLDQAQSNLSKRLGSEVGVSGVQTLFKDAPTATSPTTGDPNAQDSAVQSNTTSTGSKTGSKGYLNSWRKLRNKSSSTNLSSGYSNKESTRDYITTMVSVPMTSNNDAAVRHRGKSAQPLNPESAQLAGANGNYMSALSKLCDATAVLDQISRQAEDPGLKFTTQTHVGLELSARHAAEFFGFYLCRFVLQDMSVLSEKYLKRSTEWVMS